MDKIKTGYNTVILALSVLIIAFAALLVLVQGSGEEQVRILIRWSAKISVTLFSVAFGVSAVHYFLKGKLSDTVLKYRPHIGLGFGVFHSFHLLFLIWLQYAIHPVFTLAKTSSLIGGGMAYGFMYLMMITTYPGFKSGLSTRQWKILHTVGGYWIWIIFFRTYFKKVVSGDQEYFLFGLLALVLAVRLIYLYAGRKKHADLTI